MYRRYLLFRVFRYVDENTPASPVDMYLGAVHAAPGAAGEVPGVPQAAVGAELAVDPAAVAHVVQLTRGLGVRVVPGHVRTCSVVNLDIYTSISGLPAIQLIFAGERGLRDIVRSVYWEVQTSSAKALGKAIIVSVIVIIFICFNEVISILLCFSSVTSTGPME